MSSYYRQIAVLNFPANLFLSFFSIVLKYDLFDFMSVETKESFRKENLSQIDDK